MSEHIIKTEISNGALFIPYQSKLSESVREEIVRCRDCDYYDHWDAYGPYREKHVCGHWDYLEINPNGFCAWGERKENGRQ